MEEKKGTLIVKVPGKVILFGEHSVVYGKRSVVVSLGLFATIKFTPISHKLQVSLPDIDLSHEWDLGDLEKLMTMFSQNCSCEPVPIRDDQISFISEMLHLGQHDSTYLPLLVFVYLYCSIFDNPISIKVEVHSELPMGGGLGSSAAYGCGLAAGFLSLAGCIGTELTNPDHLKLVSDWGFCCEKIIHGSPSGVDNTVCTYGGAISFKKGNVEKINLPAVEILLINTKVSRNTKSLVSKVKVLHEKYPPIIDSILDAMDALSETALSKLQELGSSGDQNIVASLEEIVNINQCLLCALGVSHFSIDNFVAVARSYGLAAKLTGSGGGGCGFILVGNKDKDCVQKCIKKLKDSGFDVYTTSLGAQGLHMKKELLRELSTGS